MDYKNSILFRGFDDTFMVPQSRHTTFKTEDIKAVPQLKILASSKETGVYAVSSEKGKQIFITGHSEYDANTLADEYFRDLKAGEKIEIPKNYFRDDNPENPAHRFVARTRKSALLKLAQLLRLPDHAV